MICDELIVKAENGNIDAMLDIANSYFKGANTVIDKNKAFYWYNKAFELEPDNVKAINGLADCCRVENSVNYNIEKSIGLYKKSASMNDGYALCMMAHSYFEGVVNDKDIDKAIEYYERAARLNYLEAIDSLYNAYCDKYGDNIANIKYTDFLRLLANEKIPLAMVRLFDTYTENLIALRDENTALYYLNQAVEMNCPYAITTLACAYSSGEIELLGKDEQKSKELTEKAASLNDEWALYIIAQGYNYGTYGYPQDVGRAKEYYERCIEIGELYYSHVLCELGLELCDIQNSFYDSKRGVSLLSKASDLGNDEASNRLGYMYQLGLCVPADTNKAIAYYKTAAENDFPPSQYRLGSLLLDGLFGAPKDEKTAIDLFERAAQQGDYNAMQELGICAYEGKGMPVDKDRARMLFEICAKQGLPQSLYDFALMNYHGEGGPQNYKAAEYWYNKVIESENEVLTPDAKWNLAFMYSNDTKEYEKAFPLWTEFANEGNPDAQYNLGLFYANGWAVLQDDNKAKYWMGEAAKQGHSQAIEAINYINSSNYTPEKYGPHNEQIQEEKDIPADISIFKKIIIFSTIFFVIGFLITMIVSQEFLISLLVAYLVSVLPLSIMRLKGLKMSSGQAVMTAAAGYFANGENGCTFALAFMLGRWIMNYLISVITSPYWYIKSIVMLVKSI
ncbi:MAG: tetratricopeptide repeat protein [Ruminococcus sp.]